MKYKAHVIVGFAYLRYLVTVSIVLAFVHFMYSISPLHAKIIVILTLTELVASYSIKLLGRDYLNEFLDKLYKESNNERKEEGSSFEGNAE